MELLERENVAAAQLRTIIHGTTRVTNALIERKGARTALLTTEGFRDALAIGTEHRYDMYDLFLEKPEPLVGRNLRYGVRERTLDDGSVAVELDEGQVRSISAQLRERGIEAVAVSFLHAFRNPAHERRVAQILSEEVPEIREYERTSTTVANVYVRPLRRLPGGTGLRSLPAGRGSGLRGTGGGGREGIHRCSWPRHRGRDRPGPEPDREVVGMAQGKLDPILLEVLWNRLVSVVEEQARALMRTSFTSVVREAGDLSAGVFDRRGRMVAQAVTGS